MGLFACKEEKLSQENKQRLKPSDLVIVRDAQIPLSSAHEELQPHLSAKRRVIALNEKMSSSLMAAVEQPSSAAAQQPSTAAKLKIMLQLGRSEAVQLDSSTTTQLSSKVQSNASARSVAAEQPSSVAAQQPSTAATMRPSSQHQNSPARQQQSSAVLQLSRSKAVQLDSSKAISQLGGMHRANLEQKTMVPMTENADGSVRDGSSGARAENCRSMRSELQEHELRAAEFKSTSCRAQKHELPSSQARCRTQARSFELLSTSFIAQAAELQTSCRAQA
ncbi:hypothetical protein SLEP1_g44756 [Rubroshorea leprosula]|uniref:Uncharacterized protein n=1 Tax=Rubroshorea leprosula TaxID=152421 RepID=A0AAV5LH68_9ROSI|nr:hypothetical protein SLEP1_g44756 [Rubroshorea leprosula]